MSHFTSLDLAFPRKRGPASHGRILLSMLLGLSLMPCAFAQDITGTVVDAQTGQPVSGARVHQQARPDLEIESTNLQGRFVLPVAAGASGVPVAAARTYLPR